MKINQNLSSAVLADGKIYYTCDNRLAVLSASPQKFQVLAIAVLKHGASYGSPAIAGGKLFLKEWPPLSCYDLSKVSETAR